MAYNGVDAEPDQPGITTVDPPAIGAPFPVVTPLLVPMYTNTVLAAATVMVTDPVPGGTTTRGTSLVPTVTCFGMIAMAYVPAVTTMLPPPEVESTVAVAPEA